MHPVAAAVPRRAALAERPAVRRVARAFEEAGHELALVGGPVRDALLGREVTDLDFTTDALPEVVEHRRRAGRGRDRRDHHLPPRRLRALVPQAGGGLR